MRASLARFFQAKDTLRQTAASIQPSVAWRRPLVWMKTSFCLQIGKRPKASSDKTPGRCLAAESSCPSSAKYCRQNGILIQDRAHSSRASSQSAKANHVARERADNQPRQGTQLENAQPIGSPIHESAGAHGQAPSPCTQAQTQNADKRGRGARLPAHGTPCFCQTARYSCTMPLRKR